MSTAEHPQISAPKLKAEAPSLRCKDLPTPPKVLISEDFKPTTPFGELPILEVQGRVFCAVFLRHDEECRARERERGLPMPQGQSKAERERERPCANSNVSKGG